MKKQLCLLFIIILSGHLTRAQYWSATGASTSAGAVYLITATHVGDHIYVVGNNQTFAYSTNKGSTWTSTSVTLPKGIFAALYSAAGRLYASAKVNNYDYELYYSTDNGTSWTLDTVGLPLNIVKSGKAPVKVKDMGNDYMIAYNSTTARVKHKSASSWSVTTIDNVVTEVVNHDGNWYAVGVQKIVKSNDHGASWNALTTSGLPANFQGSFLASNGSDRLWVSVPPANGGEDIYFSDDDGASWSLTNSAGNFAYSNPWVGAMYAVGNYLFAAVSPKFANFQDPPPFIISSAVQPSFSVGDTSGLPRGGTTTDLPFFFHIGDKLYTMMGDLHTSTPGFPANVGITERELTGYQVYPNPASDYIRINSPEPVSWELHTLQGQRLGQGKSTMDSPISLQNLSPGVYFLSFPNEDRPAVRILKD